MAQSFHFLLSSFVMVPIHSFTHSLIQSPTHPDTQQTRRKTLWGFKDKRDGFSFQDLHNPVEETSKYTNDYNTTGTPAAAGSDSDAGDGPPPARGAGPSLLLQELLRAQEPPQTTSETKS